MTSENFTVLEQQWQGQGFTAWPSAGGFIPMLTRLFYKPQGEHLVFRAEIRPDHCNGFHIVHGGFIATMADSWLACNVAHLLPKSARFVTASLSVDFLRPLEAGAWIESEIDRIKLGSRLCHASGAILSEDRPVASMRALFAILNK